MPRRRSAATMERDARAYDLFRRGLSYRQIGSELGFSHQSASDAIRRAAKDNAVDPLEAAEARQLFLDRLQDYRRAAQRVLATKHYVASAQSGKLAYGPDGQPMADSDPNMRALDRLLKIDDMELRIRDLYPPARSRIEVITEDVVDAELSALARQVAENDALTADTRTAR